MKQKMKPLLIIYGVILVIVLMCLSMMRGGHGDLVAMVAVLAVAVLVAVIWLLYQKVVELQKRVEALEKTAKTDQTVRPD